MAFSSPVRLLTVRVQGLLGSAPRPPSPGSCSGPTWHHEGSLPQGRAPPAQLCSAQSDASRRTASSSPVPQVGEWWEQGLGRWLGFWSGSGAPRGHCWPLALPLSSCRGEQGVLETISATLRTEVTSREAAGAPGPESV